MKKIILLSLFALSPMFVSASVVEPTPTPEATPVVVEVVKNENQSSSGGFMNVCYYIKAYDKKPCVDSPKLQQKFIFDKVFHDYVIGHWFATWRVTFN